MNDSGIHVDVMIGSDEMEVTGYGAGVMPVPIVRDGRFQLRLPGTARTTPVCSADGQT